MELHGVTWSNIHAGFTALLEMGMSFNLTPSGLGLGTKLGTLFFPHRPIGPCGLIRLGSGSEMIGALLAEWEKVVGIEKEPQ